MTLFGWTDADPVQVTDPDTYEMGTEFITTVDLTLTHVRIFSGASPVDWPGRIGRIWTTGGLQLGQATMPTALTAGWSLHALDAPVACPAGTRFIVSAGIGGNYAAITNAFGPAAHVSSNGALISRKASDAVSGNGVFNLTPGLFPSQNFNSTFYGVDVGYDLGIGGNTAPVISNVTVSASGLEVTAAIVATDAQTLGGASYTLDWQDGSTTSASAGSHTYASAGLKAILASVTDAGGLSDYFAAAINLTAPASAGLLIPTTELVAVAWLKLMVPYLGNRVATELPQDNSSWSASGFTVVSATGGSPHPELEVARPVVTVDTYAVSPSGSRPPWNLANQQAEQIKHQAQLRVLTGGQAAYVTLPAAYRPARVFGVRALTEPRRVPGDQGNYARYTQDLEVWWT